MNTLTKILAIILLVFTITISKAQVAIGKNEVTNESVSLEFGDTENRGLILSYVEDKSGITEEGTIIYDVDDFSVKYLNNSEWIDLSGADAALGQVALDVQLGKEEKATAKVTIGEDGETNTTPGILVLSDTDKAMILPKVESPHLNIINPASGMMVYDSLSKQLAVYNGTVWSFWKP